MKTQTQNHGSGLSGAMRRLGGGTWEAQAQNHQRLSCLRRILPSARIDAAAALRLRDADASARGCDAPRTMRVRHTETQQPLARMVGTSPVKSV